VLGNGAAAVLPYALAGSAALVYIAGGALSRGGSRRRRYLNSVIVVGQREARISALLDTGNELRDPLTRQPVLVVEYSAVSGLLPPEVQEGYAQGRPEVVAAAVCAGAPGEVWGDRVRLLPFRSLGASRGLLLGFRPDAVLVIEGPRQVRRRLDGLLVAVSPRPLGGGQGYQALLPPSAVA
jgi:stage II sporulation protein GA (sporulation sigma-E factor processing peptidase)